MSRFTAEEYLEILRARERLAKVRVKDYGYPERISCPQEVPPDKTYIVEHIRSYVPSPKLTERIEELEADIDGLKKGYHTHLDKKPKSKYD